MAIRGSGSGQSYGVSLTSGTIAAGLSAGSEVFQLRWTHASLLCVIESVRISAGSIVGFTAGFTRFDLVPARAWSADGSGGTAATLTTNNAKRRTIMATTSVGAIRIADTGALTAGTKTLDAQGLSGITSSVTATAGAVVVPPNTELVAAVSPYPIVLATNEGLVIRATVPATGTWRLGVEVAWRECLA